MRRNERRDSCRVVWPAAGLVSLLFAASFAVPLPAGAFEAFDGGFQAHGFYEAQFRSISADYAEDWDMTQWYNVFNVEVELDPFPDGIGPIELLQAYARVEVRYDCVYTRGCGMFRSANTYGDRSKSLPRRLSNADDLQFTGAIDRESIERRSGGSSDPVTLDRVNGFNILADEKGPDGVAGPPTNPDLLFDDPFPYVFETFVSQDYRFTGIDGLGGADDGHPTRTLGPWKPENFVHERAALADRVNPYDETLASPILFAAAYNNAFLDPGFFSPVTGNPTFGNVAESKIYAGTVRGQGARPFRPVPVNAPGGLYKGDTKARGLYYPSAPLRDAIDDDRFDSFPFNFRESERAWNRGTSQQDEKELKEAYLDIEMFEARLWLRIGKQSIVWGKTELFRTTDQFNPQDLALASLPTLEESRISLWSVRGVYSFWEVGPFQDVRLELAFNFDDFEGDDLGACGEAYSPNVVCQLTFGAFAHGTAGVGIAGVDRPPAPWNSLKGWEIGGRFEWRWDRFSFAVSDFYGFGNRPVLERLSTFERNVDPKTGRPRAIGKRGRCTTGDADLEPACLAPGPSETTQKGRAKSPNNALVYHHANQQIFAMICSTTIGFTSLDPTACAQTAFGSQAVPLAGFSVAQLLSGITAGSPQANAAQATVSGALLPLVTLSRDIDASDIPAGQAFAPGYSALPGGRDLANPGGCTDDIWSSNPSSGGAAIPGCGGGGASAFALLSAVDGLTGQALGEYLTPEQEALLGCGPYWGVSCDDSGLDLLNADASAILQAFAGFDGTSIGYRADVGIQPATVGFVGGPVCTFGNLLKDPSSARRLDKAGRVKGDRRLPGCRGPGDRGYDPTVDGRPEFVSTVLNPLLPADSRGAPAGLLRDQGAFGHPYRQWATKKAAKARLTPATGCVASRGECPLPAAHWQSEMAAVSWNFMLVAVSQSSASDDPRENFDPDKPYRTGRSRCSLLQPQFCDRVQSVFNVAGLQRNTVEAGGASNGSFGRRTFSWHSGGELLIRYEKRNVLGFSLDFAEDITKSNFSIEATWIEGVPVAHQGKVDGLAEIDEYNLTISLDRPTFINFLNANRTFFINSQWFFQYRAGYERGMTVNGPWNVLGTVAVNTGYYQDRLLPRVVFVYDFQSVSGAVLPQVTYRFNDAFSATVGVAIFMGRDELAPMSVNPAGPANNRQGANAYEDGVENGLAAVRDRDEVFLRLRYTF